MDQIKKNGNVIEAILAEGKIPYGISDNGTDDYLYRWFFAKNGRGVNEIVTAFGLTGYEPEEKVRWIGHWICLEVEDAIGCFDCRVIELSVTEKWHDNLMRTLDDALRHQNDPAVVTEVCPNCDAEVELRWDVKRDGYKAFCPHCGARLMLCDECQHRTGGGCTEDCDYDSKTDTCRFNRPETK
nr:MAG TPA: zinc-ribbon domain protein [Caudoviricetes sp.]